MRKCVAELLSATTIDILDFLPMLDVLKKPFYKSKCKKTVVWNFSTLKFLVEIWFLDKEPPMAYPA